MKNRIILILISILIFYSISIAGDYFDFSAPNETYWLETKNAYTLEGEYHINANTKWWGTSATAPYKNFKIEASARLVYSDNRYGYGFMLKKTGDNYYIFLISDGYACFGKNFKGSYSTLKDWTEVKNFNKSSANIIEVDTYDGNFKCYVNYELVFTVYDNDIKEGQSGFYTSNSMHVAFDDFFIEYYWSTNNKEQLNKYLLEQFNTTEPDVNAIFKKYGIKIIINDIYPKTLVHYSYKLVLTGKKPDEEYVKQFKNILALELIRYPQSFIINSGLKKVVLTQNMKFNRIVFSARAFSDVTRFGSSGPEGGTSFYDVWYVNSSLEHVRRTLHHEIFHDVDAKHGKYENDSEWMKLNNTDFKYGSGTEKSRLGALSIYNDSLTGFLNGYSMASILEDKAEIYSTMIFYPSYVYKRAKSDRIIGEKVERIKKFIKSVCPEMNEEFWEKQMTKEVKQ